MATPSQSLIAISADQFRMAFVPSSASFAASNAAQSATRPALLAGFDTAIPLEHCAVNWLLCRALLSDAPALKAVAPLTPVSSSETAITPITASNARAVAVLITRLDIDGLMFIR